MLSCRGEEVRVLGERQPRRFTPEEYLLIEERATTRSEFYEGEIFAMSGGTLEHNRIVRNLLVELHLALQGSPCEVLPSDMRLLVENHTLYTYPDLLVVCGPPRLVAGRRDTVTDATLVLEVLSPSTAAYARGDKFRFYRGLPSLVEYVLVAQDEVLVEQHHRQARLPWVATEHTSLEGEVHFTSIGVTLPLGSIYAGVFPAPK